MSDLISRQDAIAKLKEHRKIFCKNRLDFTILPDKDKARVDEIDACIATLINLPSAQPERLTDDDFETIRIHLNAYKESLCNQRRWKEAEDYQRLIERFMSFASAQPDVPDINVGDMISRQAAVTEIAKFMLEYGGENEKRERDALHRAANGIKALPSAQPKQRWISSGKKPPKEGSYLVWMPFAPPKHRIAVAEYCGGYWNIKTPISAWMPLPEPYNAERRTDGEETDRKTNHFKTVDIYLQSGPDQVLLLAQTRRTSDSEFSL